MNKEIREQINKVKNWKHVLNEDNNVKTYTWTSGDKKYEIKYHLSYDVFNDLYRTTLLGGEFDNTHGQGKTEKDAVKSLIIRLYQLRNKKD